MRPSACAGRMSDIERETLMTVAIYGGAHAPRAAVAGRKSAPRKNFFALFLSALREMRRREARREIGRYAYLLPSAAELSVAVMAAGRDLICPVTQRVCMGDRSYLCKDYGCARKGGLSPHSEENF